MNGDGVRRGEALPPQTARMLMAPDMARAGSQEHTIFCPPSINLMAPCETSGLPVS